ncbi:MAG TPA: acyl carrier protein [Planctomycetota bacterium]|nr:acyl carrier protein [Planctomycetota bacterium]
MPADLTKLRDHILKRFAPRGTQRLDDGTSLVKSGWIDSFAIVELVAFVENEMGVRLPDAEVVPEHFESLASIRAMLERAASR